MSDTHTTITIDEELRQKAKEAGINISALTERAIKDKLNVKEVHADKTRGQCDFCKRWFIDETGMAIHQVYATADNLDIGLMWLCPDEKWICQSCLNYKKSMVNVAVG